MTVVAIGKDREGNVEICRNGNYNECLNIPGACTCVHAEMSLLKKMPNPEVVVVSHSPCISCAKALVDAGVESVYYVKQYRLTEGVEYLVKNYVYVAQIGAGSIKEVL